MKSSRCENDAALKEGIQTFEGHNLFAEFGIGIGLIEAAPLGGVIELRARDERGCQVLALAQDAAVLGRWAELGKDHTHLPAEVKTLQVARGGEKAALKEVRRRFARLGKRPHGIRENVVPVIRGRLGEEQFHGDLV